MKLSALLLVSLQCLAGIPYVVVPRAAAAEAGPASVPSVQHYKPDLATGRTPTDAEVLAAEREAAARPTDFATVRKLGKTYFYRFFGGHEDAAGPKARATLSRALTLKSDDAETLAFLGSVERLSGHTKEGAALMAKARKLDPTNIAVLGLQSGFGDVSAMEELHAMPSFSSMSDHGRQRIFLGLGRDRLRAGKAVEARAFFTQGLACNKETPEGRMIASELKRMDQ